MEITRIYAVAFGGVFLALFLANCRRYIKITTRIALAVFHSFSFIQVLPRFSFLGPWYLPYVVFHASFITVHIYLIFFNGLFRPVSARVASARAGNLALINLLPLTVGPSQSFLAHVLGLSLSNFQKVHRVLGLALSLLLAFHAGASFVSQRGFSLDAPRNRWALIAGCWLLLVLILVQLRRHSYELFTQSHQLLAVLLVVPVWKHLTPNLNIYFYLWLLAFPIVLLLHTAYLIYTNTTWVSRLGAQSPQATEEANAGETTNAGEGMATISNLKDIIQKRMDEEKVKEFADKPAGNPIQLKQDIIQIQLNLYRPVRVKEGQYIGLCIPTSDISKASFLQVHPFMVASWSEGGSKKLNLLVEPRQGWTKKLLRYSKMHPNGISCRAFFTGPYGVTVPTQNYGMVLLIAGGHGIIAQLPYLKQMIHSYNACRTRTRRIHLVWQLDSPDLGCIFEDTLNEALINDTLDDGRILSISIFVKSGQINEVSFGKRVVVGSGCADLKEILQSERAGSCIKRVQEEEEKKEDILILVSATKGLKDEARKLAGEYVYDRVTLAELEYQPD